MRQPLRNTAVAGMIGLSSMASSNALYFQTHHHPAPLFGATEQQVASVEQEETMAVPAPRPKSKKLPLPDTTTTGSVEISANVPQITNDDVRQLQLKLEALKFYEGKADGLYGPRTAKAIRAFESKNGLPVKGQLTEAILSRILAASPAVEVPEVAAAPEPEWLPLAAAKTEPVTLTVEPLPAPKPLAAIDTAAPVVETVKPAGRVVPDTPEEALNLVADTAHDALDTIIDGVQTMTMNSPAPVKRVVQTIAVKASTQAAATQTASVEVAPAATVAAQPLPAALPAAKVTAEPVSDADMVASVQRGLSSLGFLHGPIDGVAGEATAKAIRNFEVYYNYNVTGRVTPELVNLLVQNGAVI
jgi:peptidoglycan hydrolase-like protein with peptidoglycan-binding domain